MSNIFNLTNLVDWKLQGVESRFSIVGEIQSRSTSDGAEQIKRLLAETEATLEFLILQADRVAGKKAEAIKKDLCMLHTQVEAELAWWTNVADQAYTRTQIVQKIGLAIREVIHNCDEDEDEEEE